MSTYGYPKEVEDLWEQFIELADSDRGTALFLACEKIVELGGCAFDPVEACRKSFAGSCWGPVRVDCFGRRWGTHYSFGKKDNEFLIHDPSKEDAR